MHILRLPSFFLMNKTGDPQGDELGLIYPFSIHLGSKRVLGVLRAACTTAGAALRGGARRRARVQVALGSGLGAGGSARVRKAKARLGEARAALRWACHGEVAVRAAAERRSGHVSAAGVTYGPKILAQGVEGIGPGLTYRSIRRSGGRGWPISRRGGDGRRLGKIECTALGSGLGGGGPWVWQNRAPGCRSSLL